MATASESIKRTSSLTPLLILVLTVLVIATGYELAFALGLLPLGRLPGKGPEGSNVAVVAGLLAMVSGAVLSFVVPSSSRLTRGLAGLLAPAGAAFITARFYTFDPYYLPTMRRISEGGVISPAWIFGLVAAAVVAGVCAWLWPPLGSRLTGIVLILCIVTTFLQAAGH
jgi:hypothetical protein